MPMMRLILLSFPSLPDSQSAILSLTLFNKFCFHFLQLSLISIYHKAKDHLGWPCRTPNSVLRPSLPALTYCPGPIDHVSFTFYRGIAILRTILQIGMLRLRKIKFFAWIYIIDLESVFLQTVFYFYYILLLFLVLNSL